MTNVLLPFDARVVHVRFEGRSQDITFGALGLSDPNSNTEVRRALARYLDVPANKLADYVVQRHANGNITVRPEAVFG